MTRLFGWLRIGLDMLGGATLLALAVFYGSLWLLPENARYQASPPVSPVAEKIAAWVSPGVVRFATDAEDDFARAAPKGAGRWIFHRAYPYALRAIPAATKVGVSVGLDRFGSLTAREMAQMLVEHQRFQGRDVHPTVRALAERTDTGSTLLYP